MKFLGMRNFIYARLADAISLFHAAIVVIAAFGWWLLPYHPLHFLIIVLTLASWIFTGSCILARAEFRVRKQYMDVPPYEHGYLHYHLHRLTRLAPSLTFIRIWGLVYLTSASVLWIVQYAVHTGMLL